MADTMTRGTCCICYGTVDWSNRYTDLGGDVWDFHAGKCAILAGTWENFEQSVVGKRLIGYRDVYVKYSVPWHRATQRFYEWVDSVASVNHYDECGPLDEYRGQ